MDVDASKWSGEGEFTAVLIECLRGLPAVTSLRVEDAPASRTEADYNFISNELFVSFATRTRKESIRRFGLLPGWRAIVEKEMTLTSLERTLAAFAHVREADYVDDGMLQYLRTERIVPPYQTRGYKLVELVRIYEAGAERRS